MSYIMSLPIYKANHNFWQTSQPLEARAGYSCPICRKTESSSELRPISVTSILSRVTERIIVKKYLLPSLPQSLLNDQFAYKPTGSTTAALIVLSHHVAKLLENFRHHAPTVWARATIFGILTLVGKRRVSVGKTNRILRGDSVLRKFGPLLRSEDIHQPNSAW